MNKRLDVNECEDLVKSSKNVIFHGAPGTGKTYLAKQIAAKIVSNDCCDQYAKLENLQNQVGFIQFYPGYDYSNFVEGYKPSSEKNENIKFSLDDGIFKAFVYDARKKYEECETLKKLGGEDLNQAVIKRLQQYKESEHPFYTYRNEHSNGRHNKFYIAGVNPDGGKIDIDSKSVKSGTEIALNLSQLLEGPGDLKNNFGINEVKNTSNLPSYYRPIWDFLFNPPKFVFIIDEINRGNTSSIFGELFYAIDPNNRGKKGEVTLQYSGKKFYIPENVLIIGTMNDIDRSVEPFDFAFRRRWTSKLIEPTETQDGILSGFKDDLKDGIVSRMNRLNAKIQETDGLGADYQIGAAYFLKLKDLSNDFDKLWNDSLEPLLKEYVYGMDNAETLLKGFKKAYYTTQDDGGLQEQN